MNRFFAIGLGFAAVLVGVFCDQPASAQTGQLPTLDQAMKISSETGRPIFAMAGQST